MYQSVTILRPVLRARGYLLAFTLMVGTVLAGCSMAGIGLGGFNLVSIEEEWALGAQLERDLAQQLRIVHDPTLTAYVNQMGQRIAAETELAHLPWKFHVVADPSINAFNIPGGHVYVHTGLVTAAQNTSELAAVMAHEVAHGAARHGTRRLTQAYGLSIVAGLILGQSPAIYEQILAQIVGTAAIARFSRADEREADRRGITYMYGAGYNPQGVIGMFETIAAEQQRNPTAVERFFSTHPLTQDRIDAARSQIRGLPARQGLITNDAGFGTARQRAAAVR